MNGPAPATSRSPVAVGDDAAVIAAMTPTQLDHHLRRRLAGRRLVCEVTWSRNERDRILLTTTGILRHRRPRDVGADYPALLVTYLVRVGAAKYDGDDGYWGHTCLPRALRNEAGVAFEAALAALRLETFPHFDELEGQRPLRFLSRILAHTGMPKTTARVFLDEVAVPMLARNGRMSADELIASLRIRRPAMTRTAARFLFHGGRTAADLLGRMLDALDLTPEELRADGHGLPVHLRDAILEIPERSRPRLAAALPRPRVELDPYGGAGPELVLPALERELYAETTWQLGSVPFVGTDRDSVTAEAGPILERVGRRFDEERIALAPTGSWHLEATVEGKTRLDLDFECFSETDIVCFDGESWLYLRQGSELRADDIWIVTRPGTTLAVRAAGGLRPPQVLEAPRAMHGSWAGHTLGRYSLTGAYALVVTSGARISVVPVATSATGPSLVGPLVRDTTGLAGEPVHSEAPLLHLPASGGWTVVVARLDRDGRPVGEPDERTIEATDSDVELPVIDEALPFGRHRIVVRGSIGGDLRETIIVVPGLAVDTPDASVLAPGEVVVPVRSALDRRLLPEIDPGLAGDAMVFPHDSVSQELWAWRANHDGVGMRVRIPRLRWALRSVDVVAPVPGTVPLVIDPATLTPDDAIILEVGRPGIGVDLDLVGPNGALLQATGDTRRTSRDGVLELGLARYIDTWRATPRARLVARLPGGSVTVASPLTVSNPAGRDTAPLNGATQVERPSTSLSRGTTVSGTVTRIQHELLLIDLGEGVTGRAFIEYLPRDISRYRVGQTVEGRILVESPMPKLDLRTFDERAHTSGDTVSGRVGDVRGSQLTLALEGGGDAVVSLAGLPPGRASTDYRSGDRVEGTVISRDGEAFRWRVTLAGPPSSELRRGQPIVGVVRGLDRGLLVLDLNSAVGTVDANELPHGRAAHTYTPGERVDAWVVNRDDKWRIAWCSLRPFTVELVPGDRISGVIERTSPAGAHIRTDDGHLAFAPRVGQASDRSVGERVVATVTMVDARERRLDVSLSGEGPAYVSGDSGSEPSPFEALRELLE